MDRVCLSKIIQDLKDCSAQTDKFINDFKNSGEAYLDDWFSAIREFALDIKNGVVEKKEDGQLEDNVPELDVFLDRQQKVEKRFGILMSSMQKEHLHKKKDLDSSSEILSKKIVNIKNETSVNCTKINSSSCNSDVLNNEGKKYSSNKDVKLEHLHEDSEKIETSYSSNKESKVEHLYEDSEKSTSYSSNKQSKVEHSHGNSVQVKENLPQENNHSPLKFHYQQTQKESENSPTNNEKWSKEHSSYMTPVMRKADISNFNHSLNNVMKVKLKHQSALFVNGKQPKRKSSEPNENDIKEDAKKRKINHYKTPTTQLNGKLGGKNLENSFLKGTLCHSSSFVVPQNQKSSVAGLTSFLLKPPVTIPKKERQLLKEIQKKEEKTSENLKKALTLRQMKIEENKKKRQEKMDKNLQKRLQIEKEKEERFRNHKNSVDLVLQKGGPTKHSSMKLNSGISITDSQHRNPPKQMVKIQQKTPSKKKVNEEEVCKPLLCHSSNALKDRSQEMNKIKPVSSKIKAGASGVSNSSSQTPGLNTTYVAENSEKSIKVEVKKANENKAVSESSFVNYEIGEEYVSDADEEEDCKKPIPSWARGIPFKNALLTQHYNPLDADALFGTVINPPDLDEIFGYKKKYKKRTSSAIWRTPDRPFFQ